MGKKKNLDLPLKEQIKPIFKERFIEMLGSEEEYSKFVETILKPQRKSFRINTIKEKEPEKLKETLVSKGLKLEEIPWSKHSYYVKIENENDRTDLGNLYEHFLGKIYVQESTSMTPAEVLEIPENISEKFMVLDMAAAPGSKTTQVGCKMNNKGILVANELDYSRIGALQSNLERTGISNILIINNDGTRIDGDNIFDRIILDAPCSGSGVIRKSPKTIRMYNPRRLGQVTGIQKSLFRRAFELLKVGGIMTYSTCSLDPEENEFIIKWFLEEYKESVELLKIELPGMILNNRLTKFFEQEIPEIVTSNTIRIWPQDNDTNGFFLAKIKKLTK